MQIAVPTISRAKYPIQSYCGIAEQRNCLNILKYSFLIKVHGYSLTWLSRVFLVPLTLTTKLRYLDAVGFLLSYHMVKYT